MKIEEKERIELHISRNHSEIEDLEGEIASLEMEIEELISLLEEEEDEWNV